MGKEAAPWVPAQLQNTTEGTTDQAENHVIRTVDTGIINVCPFY
jgi:mitotic spindle assembly checkpoint protein MAD2B